MDRGDVKELGDMLDDGQAFLLVVGKEKLAASLQTVIKADKTVEKELDLEGDDLDASLAEAAGELS